MLDRDGRTAMVAYSETELVWLNAANSLPAQERMAALEDIAAMTGRAREPVRAKAGRLRLTAADGARYVLSSISPARAVMVPAHPRGFLADRYPAPLPPINQPTMAQRVAGR